MKGVSYAQGKVASKFFFPLRFIDHLKSSIPHPRAVFDLAERGLMTRAIYDRGIPFFGEKNLNDGAPQPILTQNRREKNK